MVETHRQTHTPSNHYDGVVSDFLNVPTTPPRQRKPQGKDFDDDIINIYRNDLHLMASEKEAESYEYDAHLKTGVSRNDERVDHHLKKTGKTAVSASDLKLNQSLRSSQSGRYSHYINKSNRELFSEDNFGNSENVKLGETDTIVKVINGDYEDDHNVNYYSIGNNRSFGVQDDTKEGIITPEVSDPLIDPFYHKSDDELSMNYQTARLNDENHNEDDLMRIKNYERIIYDESTDNVNDKDNTIDDGSFDNSQQMIRFLKVIKHPNKNRMEDNLDSLTQELMDDMQHIRDKREHAYGENDEIEDHCDALINIEKIANQEMSLEMIQEETEHDTTKPQQSEIETYDRGKYTSESKGKENGLKADKKGVIFGQSEEMENKRQEIMQKILRSAYSSMSTYKRGSFESLNLNAGNLFPLTFIDEMKELEELGIDAMSIIRKIMSQYSHIFEPSKKRKK
jgi:hypothetical protein